MINIIATSAFIIMMFLMGSCSVEEINGSGIPVTEYREVENFDKVSSEGIIKLFISKGETQSLKIIADDNVVHRVKSEVRNGKINLFLADGNYNNVQIEAHIVVVNLKEIHNSGVGEVKAINLAQDDTFKIFNSGAANIYLEGYAQSFDVKNEGSGRIFAFNMPSTKCNIHIQGSGDVEITCAQSLRVLIEGSGNVYYKGSPHISSSIYGSGEVIKKS